MNWWQIILLASIVAIAGVAGEVYLRLSPQRERRKKEKQEILQKIKEELERGIAANIKLYRYARIGQLENARNEVFLSARLRKLIANMLDIVREYEGWRHESWNIVNFGVKNLSLSAEFKDLSESLNLFGYGLGAFEGRENDIAEKIYQATYNGNLSFELARDSILEGRWDSWTKVGNGIITLKDIIESAKFHKFIEELKNLEGRLPLKKLRESQSGLLEAAQSLLKEIY